MSERSIVIVGGGPLCTYAMERLAAHVPAADASTKVRISVFERSGQFGAGEVHSERQSPTSYMNRIAAQIALGADESNLDARELLPPAHRPTFLAWCRAKYEATGDERFRLQPRDVPKRYLHGLALHESFERYVALLRARDGVAVDLYPLEVVDVWRGADGGAPYVVEARGERGVPVAAGGDASVRVRADAILFATGHSRNRPAPHATETALARHAAAHPPARYVADPYPLARELSEDAIPAGASVGVLGLGLTAIDVFLELTEGRGGTFVPAGPAGPRAKLRYVPSGREPALIVGSGPSGALPCCRPDNVKQDAAANLAHEPVFFTLEAVRALRAAFGEPAGLTGGREVRRLDFDAHLFPLVVLEMAYVYYRTLLGPRFGAYVRERATPRYHAFLRDGAPHGADGVAFLLEPADACFEEAAAYVSAVSRGAVPPRELRGLGDMRVVEAFRATVYGPGSGPESGASRWGHAPGVHEHRFDPHRVFDPLRAHEVDAGTDWRARVLAFLERDLADAAQNNLANPVKAACDGVWRDLRSVFGEAADGGGLSPASHRRFMAVHLRSYNRLSNGAGIEPMRKVLALIEHGVLDVSVGPLPAVEPVTGQPAFRIRGGRTGVVREAGVLIEGRQHGFDAERDAHALYPNLVRRGIVRKWRNPGRTAADDFYPGGLDLSDGFHPVREDGSVERALTFLGAPAEGVRFFQLSAARPHANSYVLNNVARWARELFEPVPEAPRVGAFVS